MRPRHLCYTTQRQGLDKGLGLSYRHADHFSIPEAGARSVTVRGDYPAIVAAYRALGVFVAEETEDGVPLEEATKPEPVQPIEEPRRKRGRPRKAQPDGIHD